MSARTKAGALAAATVVAGALVLALLQPSGPDGSDPFVGLQEQIDAWIAAGGNPAEVLPMGTEMNVLLQNGTPEQVVAQVRKIRALLSTTPAALPPTPSQPVFIRVRPIPADAEIAFHSARSGLGPEIYTMDRSTSALTQITFIHPRSPDQPYEHVAVSSDRKMIAVNRYLRGGAGPTGVWLIDLEQGRETRLAPGFFSAGQGGVDWSPDGFVYFAGRVSVASKSGIYRVRPDGSELTPLFVLDASDPGYVGDVSVSEDGSLLAYVRAVVPDARSPHVLKTQIWMARSDGTRQRMVDDGGPELGSRGGFPIGDFDPELSPDNHRVVFSRTNTQHVNFADTFATAHDLWIAPLDGSTPARRLTPAGPISIVPDWQDGLILYTEISEANDYAGLALIRPDGTGYKRLGPPSQSLRDFGTAGKWIPRGTRPAG
jgi:Tol biopolymer transport system component